MECPCDCKQQNIATVTDEFVFPLSGKDRPQTKRMCLFIYLYLWRILKADKCFDLGRSAVKDWFTGNFAF